MSLCRYLPTPSDRMAVMWTLLSIKDAVVLEYGPSGTTHYSLGLFSSMGLEPNNSLFTTHISEDDVIMGDVTRLEKSIVEVDESYYPKVIFVVGSSITAVIGTDLIGICRYMEERVSARLIPLDEGGFRGDYTVGLRKVYSFIMQELPKVNASEHSDYNILGASAGSYRIRSDIRELEDMMFRAYGMTPGVVPGLYASVEDIEKMGGAKINLVLRAEALPAAEHLRDAFGTPFVYGSPYGYTRSLEWIEQIGTALEIKANKDFLADLNRSLHKVHKIKMHTMMGAKKPKATFIGDYDLLTGLESFCEELGIQITNLICSHSLKGLDCHSDKIRYYIDEKDRLDIIKGLNKELVLADDVSLHVLPQDNTGLCVSFPFLNTTEAATQPPLMGINGANTLMETFYSYLDTLR